MNYPGNDACFDACAGNPCSAGSNEGDADKWYIQSSSASYTSFNTLAMDFLTHFNTYPRDWNRPYDIPVPKNRNTYI